VFSGHAPSFIARSTTPAPMKPDLARKLAYYKTGLRVSVLARRADRFGKNTFVRHGVMGPVVQFSYIAWRGSLTSTIVRQVERGAAAGTK
jgi:hypothetical protein